MPFDAISGDEPHVPSCRACREPIWHAESATRLNFDNDPDGARGLSGAYHRRCSPPFQSIARIINTSRWRGF